jgi:hypothetical protein
MSDVSAQEILELAIAASWSPLVHAQQPWGLVDTGTLGGATNTSGVVDVNSRGLVVEHNTTGFAQQGLHAFVWTVSGGIVNLGTEVVARRRAAQRGRPVSYESVLRQLERQRITSSWTRPSPSMASGSPRSSSLLARDPRSRTGPRRERALQGSAGCGRPCSPRSPDRCQPRSTHICLL